MTANGLESPTVEGGDAARFALQLPEPPPYWAEDPCVETWYVAYKIANTANAKRQR